MSRAVLKFARQASCLNRLRGLGLLFKIGVDGMLDLVCEQGRQQCRQLLVRLEPPEALGGLLHGGAGLAERHFGVPPAFDVAADLPDGPVHVLDDVGAG